MINLLIAGYHGFGNCGDEAILQAMTTNIRSMADDVDITALSYRPEFTKTEYGIKSVQRFNILDVISAIRRSDIILSGGGTLLQNGTSTRSLIYYLSIIKLAKLFRKRVMLYANGIGPVNGAFNRKLVSIVVNTVDVITLREKLSEADLLSIGVNKPDIIVTADPAFNLESISASDAWDIFKSESIPTDKELVGVSVRNWNKAMYGDDYILKLAEVCDRIVKDGKTVVMLPMEYPKDIEASEKVISKMKEKAYIFKKRYTPSQILGIVGCFNLMISMRLHTLIFAAVKNVPMLGVIYDPKVEYYLEELEMPEAGDVRNSRLDSDAIYAKVNDIFENMPKYKEILRKNADMMCSKANENDRLLNEQLDIIRKKKNKKM
jgi:polysaccharide pyruvyl transferase CsaB